MIKKLNIQWNARQLAKMCMNGSITFDNAIQRGYVWDVKRKSLLIESMILGYPIPAFYSKRGENKVFDMLDGKQRSNAIKQDKSEVGICTMDIAEMFGWAHTKVFNMVSKYVTVNAEEQEKKEFHFSWCNRGVRG